MLFKFITTMMRKRLLASLIYNRQALIFIMCAKKLSSKLNIAYVILLILTLSVSCRPESSSDDHTTWTQYGGSPDQSKYFNAPEITKENVNKMKVAWPYPTGDNSFYFFSPIIVDTTMYVLAKNYSLVAINALTGKEIWIHANLFGLSRRGLNYWESKDKKDKRLIFTLNNSLQAIDAVTGKTITTFGDDGYTDLRVGLDRDPSSIRRMQAMMPGVIYDDLVIVGSAPGESYFSPPGHVRAYNVVTGKLAWTFHTIPHPGEFGYDTWPKDAYKYVGAVNVWSEMSVDTERGIVYLPLGSPTYDYYGADRKSANLFGNSLVALDARTGKRLWHYQTVHHDLWDYDLSPAPQLLTVRYNGKPLDIVAQPTKFGLLYVFDRVTGRPLWPIEERPVPKSDAPGEESWATQPFPTKPAPFARQSMSEKDINPYLPAAERQQIIERFRTLRNDGLFTPPSFEGSIQLPGHNGGANFQTSAVDPTRGEMYVVAKSLPTVIRIALPGQGGRGGGALGGGPAAGIVTPEEKAKTMAEAQKLVEAAK